MKADDARERNGTRIMRITGRTAPFVAAVLAAAVLAGGCAVRGLHALSPDRTRAASVPTQTHAQTATAAAAPTTGTAGTTISTTAATAPASTVTTATAAAPTAAPSVLAAPAALLYDEDAESLLFSRDIDAPRHPASLTKMLTAITALENCPEDAEFTVEQAALDLTMYDASSARLEAGMRLSLRALLEGLILPSGCDAGYVIAAGVGRRLAGNEGLTPQEASDVFCEKMNAVAKRIGAENSRFVNPDGYPHPRHLSTARDMLHIARAARRVPLLLEIMAAPRATVPAGGKTLVWGNSNQLLQEKSIYYLPGTTGMKTGYCRAAGYCIAASIQRDGRRYIAVVMGSPTNQQKYADVRWLMDRYGTGG